jgi:DNA-directed RNA polymerase specialized sigma24 family protein
VSLEQALTCKIGVVVLETGREVVRSLITYSDWWQPATASVLAVAGARRDSDFGDGLRAGLVETLDERRELRRRVELLSDRDRELLVLWYVVQLPAQDIATRLGVSRRHCFRLRAGAIRKIVKLGETERAA